MHRRKTSLPVAALPQRELSVKVAQVLGSRGPWRCQCAGTQTSSTSGVAALSESFFRASCSWRSESLFSQSFSVAPPLQALRGFPCLGSLSVVRHIRHIEGAPLAGVLLCSPGISHLKEHPGWGPTLQFSTQAFDGPVSLLSSCQCWRVEKERLW